MKLSKTIFAALIAAMAISCTEQPKEQTVMEDKNEVIENIMARRSIRKYQDKPVSRDTLNKIMECGINAPNGQNKQSWEVRIVDNPTVMEEIKDAMAKGHPDMDAEMIKGCFRGAPVMVFIARNLSYDFSAYDCGLMSQNIMLSAWSMGVGSICLGSPVRFLTDNDVCKPVLEKLGFSEGYELCLCIGLGYADESPEAKPRDMGKVKFVE
ncbi:MAG: nitroreductase [Prevotella sp.]|nr:nitroreductase [Prevotella sp.]